MMEETPQESFLEMHLDYDGGNILRETIRWSRFLSIVGIVGVGILILALAVAGGGLIALYSRIVPGIETYAGLLIFIFMLVLAIGATLVVMLYRFSVLTRKGIETQDQAIFNKGLKGLKIYFLISGVLALVGLLFNLLTLTSLA
jgi:hypothetical protein